MDGTSSTTSAGSPFFMVNQTYHGTPIEEMTFPDPFYGKLDVSVNLSPRRRRSLIREDVSEFPLTSRATTRTTAEDRKAEMERSRRARRELNAEDSLYVRGRREAQRHQAAVQSQRRLELQRASGQAIFDTGCECAHSQDVVSLTASQEKCRRSAMQDYPHARWVALHQGPLMQYENHRSRCLDSLDARKQERLALETYSGTRRE